MFTDGRREAHDGLTEMERKVLDAWDAGQTIERIAAATGLPGKRVGQILSTYTGAGEDDRGLRREVLARASNAFLDALFRAHPDRFATGALGVGSGMGRAA